MIDKIIGGGKVGINGNISSVPSMFYGQATASEIQEQCTIEGVLNEIAGNWSYYLGNYSDTKYNRRLFVLGMAMHCMGDAYAHRTWTIENNQWVDIKDDVTYKGSHDDYADNPNFRGLRWIVANNNVCHLLENFIYERWNSYRDFIDMSNPIADHRLEDFYVNCERVDPSSVTGVYREYIINNTSPYYWEKNSGVPVFRTCVPY